MHKLLPMRVLIINTSERIGGAAIAASRLMESLKNNGIKAKMLVRDKQTDQISVVRLKSNWLQVWKFMWERIVIWSANRSADTICSTLTLPTQVQTSPHSRNFAKPT